MKALIWMVAVATVVTVGTSACRSSSSGGLAAAIARADEVADTSGLDSTQASVRIENSQFADLAVYVISEGGMRMRIGMANGNTTTVIVIPQTVVLMGAELRFILRPIGGGREEASDRIFVSPGDEVVLTLLP